MARRAERNDRLYVGIDAGKDGAVAFLQPGRGLQMFFTPLRVTRTKRPRKKTASGEPVVETKREYHVQWMRELLAIAARYKRQGGSVLIGLERQWPRPDDSKHNVQAFAEGYATWKTVLELLGLRDDYKLVSPTSWKPRYVETGAGKEASIRVCLQLYPRAPLPRKKGKPLKRSESQAEAVLIADYLYRQESGLPYPRTPPKRSRAKKEEDEPRPQRKSGHKKRVSILLGKMVGRKR